MYDKMNWKAGDMAMCIKVDGFSPSQTRVPPLRLNVEYVVNKVMVCECGNVRLDVGISSPTGSECGCGATTSPKSGIWWCAQERFAKKNTATKEEQIEKAIKEENYELAEKLKNS